MTLGIARRQQGGTSESQGRTEARVEVHGSGGRGINSSVGRCFAGSNAQASGHPNKRLNLCRCRLTHWISESNQSSQVSSRIWKVHSGQPSSYKTKFAAGLVTVGNLTDCVKFAGYFARKVNKAVSFNGSPGLTTMDGKFW